MGETIAKERGRGVCWGGLIGCDPVASARPESDRALTYPQSIRVVGPHVRFGRHHHGWRTTVWEGTLSLCVVGGWCEFWGGGGSVENQRVTRASSGGGGGSTRPSQTLHKTPGPPCPAQEKRLKMCRPCPVSLRVGCAERQDGRRWSFSFFFCGAPTVARRQTSTPPPNLQKPEV